MSPIDGERTAAIDAVTRETQTFVAANCAALKDATVPVLPVAVGPGHNVKGIAHLMNVLRTH